MNGESGEKPQPPDPLEQELEIADMAYAPPAFRRALAAIRVLKRGHKGTLMGNQCKCGSTWPCKVLAETVEALRGGK